MALLHNSGEAAGRPGAQARLDAAGTLQPSHLHDTDASCVSSILKGSECPDKE